MMKITRVEEMPVYKIFFDLAVDIEKTTKSFPKDFVWLRIQMLRSSESVCANMAEGFYAQYSTEYLQSLHRCRREARETMTHIRFTQSVNQLQESAASPLLTRYEEGCRQLTKLQVSNRNSTFAEKANPAVSKNQLAIIYQTPNSTTINHKLSPSS